MLWILKKCSGKMLWIPKTCSEKCCEFQKHGQKMFLVEKTFCESKKHVKKYLNF